MFQTFFVRATGITIFVGSFTQFLFLKKNIVVIRIKLVTDRDHRFHRRTFHLVPNEIEEIGDDDGLRRVDVGSLVLHRVFGPVAAGSARETPAQNHVEGELKNWRRLGSDGRPAKVLSMNVLEALFSPCPSGSNRRHLKQVKYIF